MSGLNPEATALKRRNDELEMLEKKHAAKLKLRKRRTAPKRGK